MVLQNIDLGPATVVLCVGTALLLATRLVEIYSHRRAQRRARRVIEASVRARASDSKST